LIRGGWRYAIPAWWESSFDPNSYKFRDRDFFAG
jgi:hypothetical protein